MGAVTPLGPGADALYARWRDGECAIEDGMARCDWFDPAGAVGPEAAGMDRVTQLALAAADEALLGAGWTGGAPHEGGASARRGAGGTGGLPYEGDEIACVVGTGIGGVATLERHLEADAQGAPPWMLPDVA